jgi:chromosome segregation ATPase
MPEELTKEQLHEGFALAKALGNGFRAFKDAERVITVCVQAQQERDRLQAEIEALRQDRAAALQSRQEAQDLLAQVQQDLSAEAERLAAHRETELANIARETERVQAALDTELRKTQEKATRARLAQEAAAKEGQEELALLNAEIANRKKVLEDLNAEIASIKARLG